MKRWGQDLRDWRDRRLTRSLQDWVSPTDYPHLSFVAPTRALRLEMLRGPDREPETRLWIDQLSTRDDQVLWDIGAHVGSFSVYAASRGLHVVAVEPMPHNQLLLVKNIAKNRVESLCTVLPMAASSSTGPAIMRLASEDFGSAGHGFGTDQMFRGGTRNSTVLGFAVCGVSLSDAAEFLGLQRPTALKVDVDGIDDAVIYGAERVLNGVQSICCEVKFDESRVERLISYLSDQGLKLSNRTRRNAFFDRT